jgi:uncharacterized protein (TIGR02996 family)
MDQSKDTYDVAAARILRRLAEEDGIEFVSSYGVSSLTNPLSMFLLNLESDDRAAALADFLLEKDEVADLFASDEVLEEVLKQEWDGLLNRRSGADGGARKAPKPKPKEVHGARNEELEARLAREPDNVELYLVYGDWLQEQGDPLGELVTRQAAVAFVPDEQEHRKAAMQYLREHESYLVGGLARYRQAVRIDWHLGFIWSAKLWTEVITEDPLQGRVLLEWLLGLPTARFLRELWLGPLDHEGLEQYRPMLEVLLTAERPALRSLHVGVVDGSLVPGSGTDGGDLRPVGRRLPELRRLEVRVGHTQLTGLELPRLEELALELDSATKESLEALGESSLPELARLELSLSGYRLETRDLDQLAPLLHPGRLPKLRQLSLRVNETGDALVELLTASPLLEQLEQLDLSSSGLTDDGARALVEQAPRLGGLSRLDVSRNWLSVEAVDLLAGIAGPEISAGDQEEPDEGYDDDLEDISDDGDGEPYDEIME